MSNNHKLRTTAKGPRRVGRCTLFRLAPFAGLRGGCEPHARFGSHVLSRCRSKTCFALPSRLISLWLNGGFRPASLWFGAVMMLVGTISYGESNFHSQRSTLLASLRARYTGWAAAADCGCDRAAGESGKRSEQACVPPGYQSGHGGNGICVEQLPGKPAGGMEEEGNRE